ncbi:hypothetical protein [Methyloceanibacter stevinii]|uniref:hypothetical protein n=1 Tax=Methyloceanibacter stevinii TaxID=1774970 RepID=UPI0019D3ECEA|nr:hypothetical protein [Methyloceanibacter stevinii]
MDEKLRALGAILAVTGYQAASIDDEVLAAFEIEALILKPFPEPFGAGENTNAFAFAQPVPRFGPDEPRIADKIFLQDGGGRDPQLVNLDAAVA